MSRTAIVADVLRTQARQLKMPGLTRSFEDLARQAREEHWAYEDYLHEVLAVVFQVRQVTRPVKGPPRREKPQLNVLLWQRAKDPQKGAWSLPGEGARFP